MSAEETRSSTRDHAGREAATVLRPTPAPPRGIPPDTLLVNTYRVERLLGGGGMGEVYLVRHAGLGTRHAIKVIRPEMALNRQVMDLFYREARVLRGVRHEAVVSYDGFVRDDQGRDYLVMEYVEGPSLADRLRQGPLSPPEVLALRNRLAAGLSEAHRKGAVHRDISPDNVILPDNRIESAKLIDFGVCKLTDPAQETILGSSFAGKYQYASPEQLGLFGGVVEARSDLYSLGLVLAAAARGRPLEMGTTIEAAVRSRQSVPDLSGVSVGLQSWLSVMLQPDPARRPASADALVTGWPGGDSAHSKGQTQESPRGLISRGRGRPLLAVGLLLLAGAAGVLYWLQQPPTPEPSKTVSPPHTRTQTGARTQPSTFSERLDNLVQAGQWDDAFALAQESMSSGQSTPTEPTWALTNGLLAAGRLDQAFALARELASAGHGPAAFAVAEMYDPLRWSRERSPFTKPNAAKARDWYRRAAEAGVAEARSRLGELDAAQGEQ